MRFVIFGGTTEGRTLSLALAEAGAEVTVCVASAYGQEQQGEAPGVEIERSRALHRCHTPLCHPYHAVRSRGL